LTTPLQLAAPTNLYFGENYAKLWKNDDILLVTGYDTHRPNVDIGHKSWRFLFIDPILFYADKSVTIERTKYLYDVYYVWHAAIGWIRNSCCSADIISDMHLLMARQFGMPCRSSQY